jgi:hypothetical protein
MAFQDRATSQAIRRFKPLRSRTATGTNHKDHKDHEDHGAMDETWVGHGFHHIDRAFITAERDGYDTPRQSIKFISVPSVFHLWLKKDHASPLQQYSKSGAAT